MARNKALEKYQQIADKMIEADRKRDLKFMAYENMYHCQWELPEAVTKLKWVRTRKSTDPYDSIAAATRVLSSIQPRFHLQPTADNPETKDEANAREKNLLWQLACADSRRESGVVTDVVGSALLYAAVVANVVDLDYEIEQRAGMGADTRRQRIARRYGRFMVNTFNPRDVHVRRSGIMPEAVLLCQRVTGQWIIDNYGTYAAKLKGHEDEDLLFYSFMDYDVQVPWWSEIQGGDGALLLPEKEWPHKLDFLPWVTAMGGSTLEADPQHKYKPILYSVEQSGQWEDLNIALSLAYSEIIAHASTPRFAVNGVGAENIKVDWDDPSRPLINQNPGVTIQELGPAPMDPAKAVLIQDLKSAIGKSTVSSILMGGDVPSGMAFATLNLATQTAVGSLKPAKELAEKAVAEIGRLMLLWTHYSKIPLTAYGNDRHSDMGTEYVIEPDEIDPQGIYLTCELTPDVPTDRMQRANAAVMLKQVGYSNKRALEDAGVPDPEKSMEESIEEQFTAAEVENLLMVERAQAEAEAQTILQAAMPPEPPVGPAEEMNPGMFNPAAGGLPYQMAEPEATRETQTMMDRGGVPLQGV